MPDNSNKNPSRQQATVPGVPGTLYQQRNNYPQQYNAQKRVECHYFKNPRGLASPIQPPTRPPYPRPPCVVTAEGLKILDSIADVERSLAEAITVQSEQVLKGIEIAKNVDDLVTINESMRKIISEVTLCESKLYTQMRCVLCCGDCDNNCRQSPFNREEPCAKSGVKTPK